MAEPKIAIDILVNCQSATSQLKKFNKELNNIVEGGKKASNWLSKGLRRIFGAYLSFQTIKNMYETGKKMQLLERSIRGLTKSVQDWEYIKKLAHDTGNSLDTVARGYKNFYAAATMAGFGKGQIQNMYSDMVMATRAIGASSEQTAGALLALEQMISKGTVSMEELRRQLGNAVPGAFEIGAKAMKMTTKEFNEFVKTGKLASSVFVPLFIAEFKKQYAGGFKEISETVDFAAGQLKESYQELTFTIMHGALGKGLAKIIKSIDSAVRTLNRTLEIAAPLIEYLVNLLGNLWWLLAPLALGGALTKIVSTLKVAVAWITAANLNLSKTQIALFRLFIILALIQEIVAFFTPMEGALETAIMGKDQSWIDTLKYVLGILLTIDGLTMFKGLRFLLGKIPKIGATGAAGAGAATATASAGAETAAIATASATGGSFIAPLLTALGLSGLTVYGAHKTGINPMTISPYGAAMPYGVPSQINPTIPLTKNENVTQNVTYSPQYKIDATTMTPEQLTRVLDERDRNFWTRITSPTMAFAPQLYGSK